MLPFKEQQTFLNYFQNELWTTRTEKFLTKLDKVVPWSRYEKRYKEIESFLNDEFEDQEWKQ